MVRVLLYCIAFVCSYPLFGASSSDVLKNNPLSFSTKKVRLKEHKSEEYQIAEYKKDVAKKFNFKDKLRIETCLRDKYGIRVGIQTIYQGNKRLSESSKVRFIHMGKTEYVVHTHSNCTVYSGDDIQYIVVKKK